MGWVIVKTNDGGATGERYLSVQEIAVVSVKNQGNIGFIDKRGNTYTWKTDGTMASYGRLMEILQLSTNA